MGANTITVSVQLGSGGFTIARSIADRLGFRYYDWEVTSQAAEEAGVSAEVLASAERVPSLAERIMERFFSAGFYAGDIPEAVVPTSATMDTAIQELLDKAIITGKDAYKKAINKAKFEPVKDNG